MADLLFEPIRMKRKKIRYSFVQHNLVTSVYHGYCEECSCDDCCNGPADHEEVDHVWAIIDAKQGSYDPVAYVMSVNQAERIVDALNRTDR